MSLRRSAALGAALSLSCFVWASGSVVTTPIKQFSAPSFSESGHRPDIGAFYYPWYVQAQWGCLLDMAPQMGKYDSRNPYVVNEHMALAAKAGLNELIVSWWGMLSASGKRIDGAMPELFAAAEKSRMKLTMMIDTYQGRTPQTTLNDIGYLMSKYESSPAAYKSSRVTPFLTQGAARPVFMVYIPGTDATCKPADWTKAIDAVHSQYHAVVLIHKDYDPAWVTVGHFDGMFAYGTSQPYNIRDLAQRLPANAWFLPSAYPGFDASRSKGNKEIVQRSGVSTLDETFHNALDLGIDMPTVTITSFNEWTETTQIEPCRSGYDQDGFAWETYGDLGPMGYIDRTATWSLIAKRYAPLQISNADTVYCRPGWPTSNVGLWQNSWGSTGQTVRACIGNAFVFTCAPGSKYLYYQVHKVLGDGPEPEPVTIRVDYFDKGTDKFQIDYMGTSRQQTRTPQVQLKNTGAWRSAVFDIPDMIVDGAAGGKNDFRIAEQGQGLAIGLAAFARGRQNL